MIRFDAEPFLQFLIQRERIVFELHRYVKVTVKPAYHRRWGFESVACLEAYPESGRVIYEPALFFEKIAYLLYD